MKAFIKSITLFILPILIIGVSAEIALRNIPNDYQYKSNFLDQNSDNIKILFLGNSHAFYGINPEYIEPRSFNASHVSQSINLDLAILKKYKGKWDSLKCIVIPIDYFSLYERLEKSDEEWRIKNYKIYYGINARNNLTDNFEILTTKLKINVSKLYKFYFNKNSNITCSKLGFGTDYSSKINQDIIETGKIAAKRHLAKDKWNFNENVEVLKSIIEFAKEENITILLFTSPAYKTYVQNLEKKQLNNTLLTAKTIAKSYPKIIYINLLSENRFTENDFYDADHLNEIGAKKLTLKIDSLLRAKKIIENKSN